MSCLRGLLVAACAWASFATAQEAISLWPAEPPNETKTLPPEGDTTRPDGNRVAGKRVMRIGNVSVPKLYSHPPRKDRANGAAVIICPGGGHYILAWDLEGTEVARWLNEIGVHAFLLKYRVPARHPDKRWLSAVQDAQRALSLVRARAAEWNIDPNRVGALGFSAGGETAARAALMKELQYEAIDAIDAEWRRPDFAALIYPGGLTNNDASALRPDLTVDQQCPPVFFAHAWDDGVKLEHSLHLFEAMRAVQRPAELHIYSEGGHGYGLRKTHQPVTTWHHRCADWMKASGFLDPVSP